MGPCLDGDRIPDMASLASIFYYSAGITKRRVYPGGEILFRAAACTGALYHIELYLVCGDLPDIGAGVYHFGSHDFALRKLREGDYRSTLVTASGGEPSMVNAPAVIVCTGTYWRNAWKYRVRTYRHCFWDNGTILANLLAISAAHGLQARVVTGFDDESVNRLLGLDTQREVSLSLVPLGLAPAAPAGPSPEPAPTRAKNRAPVQDRGGLPGHQGHAPSFVSGRLRRSGGMARADPYSRNAAANGSAIPASSPRQRGISKPAHRTGNSPTRLNAAVCSQLHNVG